MPDVLATILEKRRESLKKAQQRCAFSEMERLAKSAPVVPSLQNNLNHRGRITLLSEMKRRSPSAGPLRDPYDVKAIAHAYAAAGASGLSVLTEPDFFGGDIDDVVSVRSVCPLPILRKDFIFDPYQIVEAKVFGASAVLLIADMCSDSQLTELSSCARDYKIEILVEVFSEESVEKALKTQSPLLGINTRNLRTLTMHPENIGRIRKRFPADAIVVAESGIKTAADVINLKQFGIASILVGESLLKQADLTKAAQNLVQAGQR